MKQKTGNKSNGSIPPLPLLPEEIILTILMLLPARTLHKKMIYVCKQWYNIIRDPIFINKHLKRSRTCLLMKSHQLESKSVFIMEKGEKGFGFEEIRFPTTKIVHPTSCDGLILFNDKKRLINTLYVLNPVTRQHVSLPRLDWSQLEFGFSCCLTKSSVGGDYKVVCRWHVSCNLMIVTVGKSNAWRSISTKTLRSDDQKILLTDMIAVDGFVHWVNWWKPLHVVTLEVDSESLSRSPLPEELKKDRCFFKTTGNFLSALTEQPCNGLLWDVWRFLDCKKGVWTKLYNIKFEPQRHMPHIVLGANKKIRLYPIGWVDNGDVLILACWLEETLKDSIAYNVKTGEATTIVMKSTSYLFRKMLSVHVNSLVNLLGI
ncbi:unnamed protein product [Dovyalis caffra]|uniref:F-box domain-containing protein n=1 Tax=Dovyalis caffra TaxID=77055 RepID=A0AAV1SP23_9ROSI|nr:unnamed protein product [Dovyalis caffra]